MSTTNSLIRGTSSAHGSYEDHRVALLQMMDGYRLSVLVYIFAKLRIADALAVGPCHVTDIGQVTGTQPGLMYRLLRALAGAGLIAESEGDTFALTDLGRILGSDAAPSLRDAAVAMGERYLPAWGGLFHSLTTGEPAFTHVFGTTRWEDGMRHPDLYAYFNRHFEERGAWVACAVARNYDFSGCRFIVDVGGGAGAFLAHLLRAVPDLEGLLFDAPHIVAQARGILKNAGVEHRCRVVGGNFIESVPEGGDLYLLKHVIHNWADPQGIIILENCRRAMRKGARLLLLETLMPVDTIEAGNCALEDIHMLAVTGGQLRKLNQLHDLLRAAGYQPMQSIAIQGTLTLIQAV